MNRRWIITRLIFATLMYGPTLSGQTQSDLPNRDFGIGVTTGSMNSRQGILGGHIAFALTDKLHLGGQLGFATGSSGSNGTGESSATYVLFAPYAKFLFPLRSDFTPILIGQLTVDNGGVDYEYVPGVEYERRSSTRTSLYFGGGGEYFPTSGLGVYGYIGLIDIGLKPKESRIGFLEPRVGVEWFLR